MPEAYQSRLETEIRQRPLTAVVQTDLNHVEKLQQRWDSVLRVSDTKPGSMKNYNPVLARWNWERLQMPEQRQLFRENEFKNITTALRERHQTKESRLALFVDENNKIRNDAFPDEPYENMLERGRAYREKEGSRDLVREAAEIEGFKKIQILLTSPDTPVGTTFMVISPPSVVKDSPYTHNFVDGYQSAIDPDSGKLILNYVRFSSPIAVEEYAPIAKRLDPEFLQRKKEQEEVTGGNIPMDAWYLQNPFMIPAQEGQTIDSVFQEYFANDIKAMEEDAWHELDQVYLPYKLYLLDQLTKPDFDPIAIAEAYNAMLVSTKKEHHEKRAEAKVVFDAKTHKLENDDYQRIAAFVSRHGRDSVQEVKAGCGNSGGFAFGSNPERTSMILNSVAQFGRQEWFKCPECRYQANGPIGNICPGCGLTKDEYAEQEGVEVCD